MSLLRRQGNGPPGGNPLDPTPASSLTMPLGTAIPSMTSSSTPSPTSTGTSDSGSSGWRPTTLAIIIACIFGVVGILFAFYFLRHTRAKHKEPKYIPTKFLKNLWMRWDVDPVRYRLPDTNHDSLEPISTTHSRSSTVPPANFDAAESGAASNTNGGTTTATVDRNTSVRSVMTLPAYNQDARQNEQVLGREGERGGIDVVIEFPETVDEEEERRNEEMEALYQVRLARRRENEEREERRGLRREARERGDFVALREISARARATTEANAGQTLEGLRAEHERLKKERQRAVSSVSYADLGVARHDGTRIRSNSHESERTGLLGDAASIAASSNYHRRDRSASSILSIDTMNSDLPSPGLTRSRADSRPESPMRISSQTERPGTSNTGRAGSSPEMIDHEDSDIPPNSPPGYENISLDTPSDSHRPGPRLPTEPPPDYSSPVLGRGDGPTFPTTTSAECRVSSTSPGPEGERRRSHVGHLISESRGSSAGSAGSRGSRGVGGVPQLPSLRLGSLPSIQVHPGSPIVRPGTVQERNEFE